MRILSAIALVACILCCSCTDLHPDYNGPLPNGYSIVRSNAQTTAIAAPDGYYKPINGNYGVVLGAKIVGMNIDGDVVYGKIAASPLSELADMETPGFFVLDTASHELVTSLSETQYRAELVQKGITALRLRDPEDFAR